MAETRLIEQRLGEISERINALEEQMPQADAKLQETFREEIAELWHKRHQAEERLAELKLQEAEAWSRQDLQTGIFRIFDDIGRRIDRLMSQVRGGG